MISGANYQKRNTRQKSLHQKIEINPDKEPRSMVDSIISHRVKTKSRIERQKPVQIQQMKKLGTVKTNDVKKDDTENQSSQIFSKTNGRLKITIKNSREYYEKVNPNGFSHCPPPFTQLLPPFIIISFVAEIILLTQNFMTANQLYVIYSVMALLILPITYFWYITTSISPTDSIQLQHLAKIQNPSRTNFEPDKHKYFCNLCKTCISHKSFHCNKCHRCVEYFDHHCKWLNNCIGAKNYVEFIQLVVLSQLFMIFFYVVNIFIMIEISHQEETLPVLFWVAVGVLAISLLPFVAITMLLCLHMYLIIAKRTTIELILENRKKNKIHPQTPVTVEHLVEKKEQTTPLPQESPITSPSIFHKQNSILRQLSVNQESHESLKKFVKNLASNLRISKRESYDQTPTPDSSVENLKNNSRINFKPTILKKTTSFASRVQTTNNTFLQKPGRKTGISEVKLEKSPRSAQKQAAIDESEMSDEEGKNTGQNLVSKLRFSTNNEIVERSNEGTTEREHDEFNKKSQTERFDYERITSRRPKQLEPLKRNHTERKIKFIGKIEDSDKENVDQEQEAAQVHAEIQNLKLEENNETRVDNSSKENEITQAQKLPSTRVFQIVSINKDVQDEQEQNETNY